MDRESPLRDAYFKTMEKYAWTFGIGLFILATFFAVTSMVSTGTVHSKVIRVACILGFPLVILWYFLRLRQVRRLRFGFWFDIGNERAISLRFGFFLISGMLLGMSVSLAYLILAQSENPVYLSLLVLGISPLALQRFLLNPKKYEGVRGRYFKTARKKLDEMIISILRSMGYVQDVRTEQHDWWTEYRVASGFSIRTADQADGSSFVTASPGSQNCRVEMEAFEVALSSTGKDI